MKIGACGNVKRLLRAAIFGAQGPVGRLFHVSANFVTIVNLTKHFTDRLQVLQILRAQVSSQKIYMGLQSKAHIILIPPHGPAILSEGMRLRFFCDASG